MSAKQEFSLFSNLFPLFVTDFICLTSSVMLKNPSLETTTTMIGRAPVYPIVYGLGRYGFNMVEVPDNVVPSKPEYCAWLLLAHVQPHSKKLRNRN
jgi:hypothetical protein